MKKNNYHLHLISAVTVGLFIFIAFGSGEDKKNEDDSTAEETEKATTPAQLTAQLKREVASFDKPFDGSTYRGTIESIQMEVVLFSVWANIVDEGMNSKNAADKKLALALKNKAAARQIKEFPKMRKAYADIVATKLWENNVYVTIQGTKNSIINLTGGLFANNKNIADTQTKLIEILTQLRFKEVRYRWYKDESEFNYYKVESPKDADVVKSKS